MPDEHTQKLAEQIVRGTVRGIIYSMMIGMGIVLLLGAAELFSMIALDIDLRGK